MKKNASCFILLAFISIFSFSSYSQSAHPEIQFKMQAKGSISEVARIIDLTEVTRKVVNHPEFEKRVKGAMTKFGKSFSYSNDSGAQVFQKMVDGAELKTLIDNIWQLDYEFQAIKRKCLFGKCSSWVLGYTNPKTNKVFINSLPWPSRDDCGIVGTEVHEQLHKLGYTHPVNNTSSRILSVPYAIGNLASEICKKYFIQ